MGTCIIEKISDLDGDYAVVYQAQAPNIPNFIWFDHTEATVNIANGVLCGGDIGGTNWSGNFKLSSDGQGIEFLAHVDPQHAPLTTFVLDQNGVPTRNKQQYNGTLKLLAIGGDVKIYGTVTHGVVSIEITFKRK